MAPTHVDNWHLPLDRAVCIAGAPGDAIEVALEDLAEEGPAVFRLHVEASGRQSEIAEHVLSELTSAAIALFPAWLPEASAVSGHSSLDFAAVRIHARRLSRSSGHYGPFLSDLAERSLGGETSRRFSDAEVAEGLAAILGSSWNRHQVALLISTNEMDPTQQRAMAAASEWLAARGFAVWLVDTGLPAADRLATVFIELPEHLRDIHGTTLVHKPKDAKYWAVAGRPHPGSAVERYVDRELSKHAWASTRRLNHPFQHSLLAPRYFLDIAWLEEKFVVELDGYEHLSPWRKAKDALRDRLLESLGFFVLRVPNERVLTDVWEVVREIEAALLAHRVTNSASLTSVKEGQHP